MSHKVLILDKNHNLSYNMMRLYFIDAAIWATRHCPSYVRFDIHEVSDRSLECDQIAEYEFSDEKDVLMFNLRWA